MREVLISTVAPNALSQSIWARQDVDPELFVSKSFGNSDGFVAQTFGGCVVQTSDDNLRIVRRRTRHHVPEVVTHAKSSNVDEFVPQFQIGNLRKMSHQVPLARGGNLEGCAREVVLGSFVCQH